MEVEPKKRHLFVVIGAGASYDCISDDVADNPHFPVNGRLRPPLVTELFDGRFSDILDQYPVVAQVASSIKVATRSDAVALEDYLYDKLRHSPHAHLRRAYWSVPLYLQHVLFEVSKGYTTRPDNYDRLIAVTLGLDRITFLTLNYDTILDNRLAYQAGSGPLSMNWYVDPARNWSLLKLHGSINWRRRVLRDHKIERASSVYAEEFASLGEDLKLAEEIELVPNGDIGYYRISEQPSATGHNAWLCFPALAVPVRTKEAEAWCPPEHIADLHDHMTYAFDGFNLLVIGYRAADDDVISLFRSAGRPVRSLLVVDRSKQDAKTIVDRFCSELPSHFVNREQAAFDGDFREFAQSSALEEYVDSV